MENLIELRPTLIYLSKSEVKGNVNITKHKLKKTLPYQKNIVNILPNILF